MKKILSLLLFAILLFPASAFAADPVKIPYTSTNMPVQWMDGDLATSSPNVANTKYRLDFSTPATLYTWDFVRNPTYPLVLQLFDSVGGTLGTIATVNFAGGTTHFVLPSPIANVSYITFSSGNPFSISEFSFTGTGGQPITENPEPEKFVMNTLSKSVVSPTSITLYWQPIQSNYLQKYNVYQDGISLGSVTTNSIGVSQLVAGQTYTFKVAPVDKFDKEYTGASTSYSVPVPDTTPPAVPTNVQVTPDRYRASVTANPVMDSDLAGYHVYLNGNRVTSQPVQLPYDLTGLKLETDYEVEIASIDTSGNLSARSQKATFKTLGLESEPSAVTVTASPYNGGASLSWNPASSAQEYKVYKADGTLVMKTTQTSAKITRLKNGQVHSFYVIASNAIGDSPKSNVVEVKPESSLAPDVALSYSLKDVSDGTSSWFSSFWLLLAFTISIPLSFYVSNRVKGLFES